MSRILSWPSLRLCAVLFALVGCTKGCGTSGRSSMPPEKVVESYLNTALNMNQVSDRDKLMDFTTGRLKDALASATEETIQQAYVNRRYQLESYAVIERRDRTPREVEITFRLKYKDMGTTQDKINSTEAPMVQTENTVALIREQSVWYIRDVVGAKTTFDFPVSQDSQIQAKPGVVTPLPEDQTEESEETSETDAPTPTTPQTP